MPTTLKVATPDASPQGPIIAYLFDATGTLLERATVKDGAVKLRAGRDAIMEGRLLLAPDIGEEPSPSVLERAQAFDPLVGRTSLPELVTIPGSLIAHWPWCICLIRGRVERPDGRPVCDARVHICEVDSVPRLIARLPDRDVIRLRDDLLDVIERPIPRPIPDPIPDPPPGPFPFPMPDPIPGPRPGPFAGRRPGPVPGPGVGSRFERTGGQPGASTSDERLTRVDMDDLRRPQVVEALDARVRTSLTSTAVPTVRKALVANPHLVLPWLCHWRWLWHWLDCDEIAVVETGDGGQFQHLFFHDCTDTPDLYFWVEFDFGNGWETVHRPPMPCNVHWNHDCSDEVVVTVSDPRVPSCQGTPTGNHDVNVLSLGRTVAIKEVQGASAGAAEGLTAAGEPFGATIEPRVDFAPSLLAAGIPYYRWSARRLTGPDGVATSAPSGSVAIDSWFPLTRTVVRHYREVTSAGTSYPAMTLGPLPSSEAPAPNLFHIPPVTTPAGDAQWRVLDEHEDLASAHFETAALTGGPSATSPVDLAAGAYELKLELFDASGALVNWTDAGIEPGITDQDAPFGTATVTTSPAPGGNRVLDGSGDTVGFRVVIRVDNNRCTAQVHPPAGDLTLDACGFHQYAQASDKVGLSFDAGHPNGLASWSFSVVRGTSSPPQTPVNDGGTVGQSGPGDWTLTGQTHANGVISVGDLLGPTCPRAAFSQRAYVATLAQNGYGRLSGYDAASHGGFALVAAE